MAHASRGPPPWGLEGDFVFQFNQQVEDAIFNAVLEDEILLEFIGFDTNVIPLNLLNILSKKINTLNGQTLVVIDNATDLFSY